MSDSPALLTGSEATGTARFHDKWSDFSVTANLAEEVTVELADVLDKRRVDHCLLSMDGLSEGANKVRLGWGEVVPLWFLSETRGTSGTRKRVVPHEVVILCSPRPRGHSSDLPDLLDQCVSLGEEVGDILEQWQQRVVVVVPGDLCSDHRAGEQAFMQVSRRSCRSSTTRTTRSGRRLTWWVEEDLQGEREALPAEEHSS